MRINSPAETRGANTIWMIRPDHPIWGSQRLIVRSAIPLPKTGALSFPDLSPLGRWGAVDSYLALVNASGRELVTEGSPGLAADRRRLPVPRRGVRRHAGCQPERLPRRAGRAGR